MRKEIRLIKRVVALFLVLLLSIESFGAVVSDNDGSAFITKAEFDSLKNNFQSQIDQYNTSIDSKIDGAIASYLAGIQINKEFNVTINVSNYTDMQWKRAFEMKGTAVKWTAKTTKATVTSNDWFVPHFPLTYSFRYSNLTWAGMFARIDGGVTWFLNGNIVLNNGSIGYFCVRTDTSTPIRPLAFGADATRDDEIVLQEIKKNTGDSFGAYLAKVEGAGERTFCSNLGHYAQVWPSGATTWQTGDTRMYYSPHAPVVTSRTDWVTINTLQGDQVMNVAIQGHYNNNRNYWCKYTIDPTPASMPAFSASGLRALTDKADADTAALCNSGYIDNYYFSNPDGVWAQYASDNTVVNALNAELPNLMLGKDFDKIVNLVRVKNDFFQQECYTYKTTYSPWQTIQVDLNKMGLGSVTPWTYDTSTQGIQTYTNTKRMTYRVPYLERYDFNKITSAKFKNKGANLKFGDGLPILIDSMYKGKAVINLEWVVERSVDAMPLGDDYQKIDIDIKNNSFLNTGTFYRGIVNDSGSDVLMQNVVLSQFNGNNKATIEINDIKEGDDIWLRIAPNNTLGGLKARILNLQVKIIDSD